MFEIGDYVVHGNSGVCRVEDIQEMGMGAGSKRMYYI